MSPERPVDAAEVRKLGSAFRRMSRLLFQAGRNNRNSRYSLAGQAWAEAGDAMHRLASTGDTELALVVEVPEGTKLREVPRD